MTRAECVNAVGTFASKVKRWLESSDASAFTGRNCDFGEINVQLLVRGGFGAAEKFFEALRVLGGHVIAADDKRPRRKK